MLSILHPAHASPLPHLLCGYSFCFVLFISFSLYAGFGVVFTLFYDVSFTIFSIFILLLLISGQLVFYYVRSDSAYLVLFHGGGGGGLFDLY